MTRWDLSTDGRYYDIRAHARHVAPTDFLPLVGFICFNCLLIAATPPTPAWKRVRAAVFPFMLSYQLWFVTSTYELPWYRCWGNATGQLWHTVKALEVLVFYPPEDHCYRIKPQGKETAKRNQLDVKDDAGRARENGHGVAVRDGDSSGMQAPPTLVPESIPPPFTLVKLYWAFSLWFSQRGIGWNYVAPLPASSMRHPFTRKSSRRAYLVNRVIYLLCVYLACNLTRAYMTFGPGAAFFSGRPGIAPSYDSLSIPERALYSVPVAAYVVWSIEEYYMPISLFMVSIGGLMAWEGEWWEPWGFPPLLGTLRDLWVHPGLSHMWSKTWHQYFHHWLYLFGWLGIGETILGLPHSGISARPRPPKEQSLLRGSDRNSAASESQTSTRPASPAHPLPSTPASSGKRTPSVKVQMANFTKSLIVFTLTGLYHDLPCCLVLLHTRSPDYTIRFADCFATSLFFMLQPFALAFEATVKRYWRYWKVSAHPAWKNGASEPAWVVTLERAIGFVWTWWWLGHTARYFVVGLTHAGLFLRQEGQPVRFSPMGGLIYGQWYH